MLLGVFLASSIKNAWSLTSMSPERLNDAALKSSLEKSDSKICKKFPLRLSVFAISEPYVLLGNILAAKRQPLWSTFYVC